MNKQAIVEYCKGMFDFKLTTYQTDFAYDCLNNKRVVAVFCRQSGKSETTSKIAIVLARKIKDNPILIFAPTDRQAGIIADKITKTLKKMPYFSYFHIKRQSMREFYFSNGGSIICETTGDTGQTILGYTAGAIIMEEAGSIKDSIVHGSILPMGAHTDPPIIKIGTPKGMNHFYESSQSEDYKVHQIPWQIAVKQEILNQSYVDELKRTLPIDKFRTEMLSEFIPDEDAYFGYKLVESCIGTVEQEEENLSGEYYLGADIARMGKDSTCFMVMKKDGDKNTIVKIIDIPKSTLDFVIDKIIDLHNKFKFQKIFIDETGLGAGVRDVLARQYNVYKKRQAIIGGKSFNPGDLIHGVKFTIQSKIDIYSHLKVMMEQGRLKFPQNRKLISQLRDFRYEVTDSDNIKLHHSEYGFDDYCDALALAAQGPQDSGFVMDL